MNILKEEDCVRIGTFRKPHGYSGTLQLYFDPQWEFSLEKAEILMTLTDGLIVPWFVSREGIRIVSSQTALVDLEWIENEVSAKKICGNPVLIEKDKISHDQEMDYSSEWCDYLIYDESGNYTGKIKSEENYAGNTVWIVLTTKGEQLIPYHSDLIRSVDQEAKTVVMAIPAGLLEI